MKHLLKLLDLSKEEIIDILNLADQLKYETKHGIEHHHLKGTGASICSSCGKHTTARTNGTHLRCRPATDG